MIELNENFIICQEILSIVDENKQNLSEYKYIKICNLLMNKSKEKLSDINLDNINRNYLNDAPSVYIHQLSQPYPTVYRKQISNINENNRSRSSYLNTNSVITNIYKGKLHSKTNLDEWFFLNKYVKIKEKVYPDGKIQISVVKDKFFTKKYCKFSKEELLNIANKENIPIPNECTSINQLVHLIKNVRNSLE
tara:strand:+ start:589 stop:1167 length:579 start_codon:yes stop_codon:yes gene_type:complete